MRKKIDDNIPMEDTTPTIISSIKLLSVMIRRGESLGTYPPVGDNSAILLYGCTYRDTLPDKPSV